MKLNCETLKELRNEIINNCSKTTHYRYPTTSVPNYNDMDHIKNYQSKELGDEII